MDRDTIEGQMTLFETSHGKEGKVIGKKRRDGKDSPEAAAEAMEVKKTRGKAKGGARRKTEKKPVKSKGASGQVPEGDVRLTANIREDLHLKLKIAAARQRTTIGELIESLVERYIK